MDYLANYWQYCSCYEIPRNYAFWSAIGLLGAIVQRRVLFMHGDIEIYVDLYIGLIGPQGNAKSTSNDFARKLFREVVPNGHIGPSRASPESIVVSMKADDFVRSFTNHLGEKAIVRPFAFFINEFKN